MQVLCNDPLVAALTCGAVVVRRDSAVISSTCWLLQKSGKSCMTEWYRDLREQVSRWENFKLNSIQEAIAVVNGTHFAEMQVRWFDFVGSVNRGSRIGIATTWGVYFVLKFTRNGTKSSGSTASTKIAESNVYCFSVSLRQHQCPN